MIRPKNETEDLLLLLTKNRETLIHQIHTRPEETLEFRMIKPKATFHFNPPIQIEDDWMLELIDLEVYKSIFNIPEEDSEFELYEFPHEKSGGVSYGKVRDEIERDLEITDNTATDLQDDMIGQNVIEEFGNQVIKRMRDDKNMLIFAGYTKSLFQDFGSYLRTKVDLVEDDIKLVLDEYNSSFITCELTLSIYTFKHLSEALFNILQPEYELFNNSVDIEFDDITMKTKLVVRRVL